MCDGAFAMRRRWPQSRTARAGPDRFLSGVEPLIGFRALRPTATIAFAMAICSAVAEATPCDVLRPAPRGVIHSSSSSLPRANAAARMICSAVTLATRSAVPGRPIAMTLSPSARRRLVRSICALRSRSATNRCCTSAASADNGWRLWRSWEAPGPTGGDVAHLVGRRSNRRRRTDADRWSMFRSAQSSRPTRRGLHRGAHTSCALEWRGGQTFHAARQHPSSYGDVTAPT